MRFSGEEVDELMRKIGLPGEVRQRASGGEVFREPEQLHISAGAHGVLGHPQADKALGGELPSGTAAILITPEPLEAEGRAEESRYTG